MAKMFYTYFRVFNWFSSIFGLRKPFIISGKESTVPTWSKIWSILIVLFSLLTHLFLINFHLQFDIKTNLDELSDINNLIVNIIIILNNIYKEDMYRKLYQTFNNIFALIKISNISEKMFCLKLYIFILINGVVFIILIILEVMFDEPPLVIIIRTPLFFTSFHFLVHLCLMLSVLRFINGDLLEKLKSTTGANTSIFLEDTKQSKSNLFYFFDPKIYFIDMKSNSKRMNLKIYYEIYDELSTGILLLENCHGLEVLLLIWTMFTSSVTAATLITNGEAKQPWLDILKGVQVFVWFSLGCYIDNQIRHQVDLIEVFIVKNLIDFRCDQTTKEALQTFKLVVNGNNLQFTACNLYRLNYSTVLGTVVSIITYSIISIQLF